MSDHPSNRSDESLPANVTPSEQREQTQQLDRYDLTGRQIRQFREGKVRKFLKGLKSLVTFGGRKARKALDCAESQLDKTTIDNQLKMEQTKTEFLNQELLRQQIANQAADTEGKQLDNAAKRLEIMQRLEELGERRGVEIVVTDDVKAIIFGNLPQPLDSADAMGTTDQLSVLPGQPGQQGQLGQSGTGQGGEPGAAEGGVEGAGPGNA